MKIEQLATGDLIPYINNSRTHDERQIGQIAASIKEFGFTNPILIDNENGIIAGHGRLQGAQKLGIEQVPCIRLGDLTEAQKKAYVIADNKLALNAGWDMDLLAVEIEGLKDLDFDVDLLGFDADELDALFPLAEVEGLTDEDEVPEVPEEPITKLGDIYQLGNHRLMCGDSTSIDAVELLMGGVKADMVFTDPPYNVGFSYNQYDDNKTDDEYKDFCSAWFDVILMQSRSIIITPGKQNLGMWFGLAEIRDVGVWIKKNGMSGGKISHLNLFEPILFIGEFDRSSRVNDLFEFNNKHQNDVADNHTCPKSAELMVDIVSNYSKHNNVVLDVFGGSGSTLIACEKTNRNAYLMELDPKYCDVIVQRWEDFTGKKAELLNV
jgi:16S rRNA G966 N2-methylase RsmD